MNPLVSIILPVFNAERYVEETILSLLNQYEEDYELIIIDDCPTDGTMAVVEKFVDSRIRIIHHETNKGVSFTRNQGIEEAKGKYIIFMDHDDVLPKTRIKNHVKYMEEHPDVAAVGGINVAIDSDSNFNHVVFDTVTDDSLYIRAYLLNNNLLINSSVTYRLSVLKNNCIKYWDNSFGLEDYVFLTAVSKVGDIKILNEVALLYRMHPNNTLKKIVDNQLDERLKVWREYFRFAYETDGFMLTEHDYDTLLDVFTEKRRENKLTHRQYGELLLLFDKILSQAKELQICYYHQLVRRFNELREKFSEPFVENNVSAIPFSETDIVDFCKYHKKIYVYGFGKIGLTVSHFVNYYGFAVEKFVVSSNENGDERLIQFDELEMEPQDGLIIALGRKNLAEVIDNVQEKIDNLQLLIPKYN